MEIVTVYRKEVFTLQACGPIDEDDPESEIVPLYGRHRKHLRIEDDEPVPAPFDDLLPYFRNKLQDVYGDIGVGGWRNTFDGTFELEDDCWRELCKLCEKGSREQKAAGRKLLHALDGRSAETDDEGDTPSGFAAWRSFSFSSFSPRARKDTSTSIETTTTASEDDDKPRVEVDEALRKKREQAVLDALWKKKDQKEGTMWRKSPRCEPGVPSCFEAVRTAFDGSCSAQVVQHGPEEGPREGKKGSGEGGAETHRRGAGQGGGACAASRRLESRHLHESIARCRGWPFGPL